MVSGPPDSDVGVSYTERGAFSDFFSRPILIQEYSWTEGNSLVGTLNPWYLYFTNARIIEKLKGFSRLRARLHLRFMVNGSPFRYSDVMVSYRPLWTPNWVSTNDETYLFSGGDCACDDLLLTAPTLNSISAKIPTRTAYDTQSLMTRSQRMNVRLKVSTSKGAEMVLPFVYPYDAIAMLDQPGTSNTTDQSLRGMGTLFVQSIFPLLTTTTASTVPVNISVYAWAEDVKIWGPTQITVQSKDEFDENMKPSAIASLVADAASILSRVPIIGPFAQATHFAATTVSSILRFFGWTNPPVIGPLVGFLPRVGLFQTNPLISSQDDVLSLDPKNEQTVDPRIVGCTAQDELSIEYLCSKDTIFDFASWQPTDAPGSPIFTLPVAPVYAYTTWLANVANPSIPCANVTMTPATYFSQLFQYWRGDMVLRLEVVCSQFHRGRLAVIWDPSPALTSVVGLGTGTQITEVIDLASSNICEIKIPYLSHRGYLETDPRPVVCKNSSSCTFQRWGNRSTSHGWAIPFTLLNGNVYVVVLNELQSANLATNVQVVASVRFENMRFMGPRPQNGVNDTLTNASVRAVSFSNLVVQSGTVEPDDTMVMCGENSSVDHVGLLYGGESVPSIRPLLHRTYLDQVYDIVPQTLNCVVATVIAPWFPMSRFQPNSYYPHQSTLVPTSYGGVGTTYVTESCATTPISYIVGCFTGFRGSMVHKFITNGDSGICGTALLSAHRTDFSNAQLSQFVTYTDVGNGVANSRHYLSLEDTMGGAALSSSTNNGCVSVQVPMYSNARMLPGSTYRDWGYQVSNITKMGTNNVVTCNAVMPKNTSTLNTTHFSILHTVACGHDFTVMGFINTPDIYVSNIND